VVLGGARSGKSRLAVRLAQAAAAPVTFVATAEAGDDEMAARIAEHRADRPHEWTTVEEPYALEATLEVADPSHTLVVDCLSLWVANALERGDGSEAIVEASARAAALAAGRAPLTVVVSNEAGLGVVPVTPLGRLFRDLLGTVNRTWVDASASALFVVAGRALPLVAPPASERG
jgi:adenosylcobinamide kinase / adenosylcobinamide-phosphate guanylyltransferase